MLNEIRHPLLEPYMLDDLQLRNRVVMAPLTRTRAEDPGHVPTGLMRQYYEQRASAGLIIMFGSVKRPKAGTELQESTMKLIEPHGSGSPTP